MKKFWIATLLALFLGGLLTTDSRSQQADILVSTDSLIGSKVKDAEGKQIGKVEKLLIDAGEGRISMAIVSVGGFLGIGDKSYAIPWESFEIAMNNKGLILKASRATIEGAPAVEKDNWPNVSGWVDKAKEYWKGENETEEKGKSKERPLSKKENQLQATEHGKEDATTR